jgi:hypothetical protein
MAITAANFKDRIGKVLMRKNITTGEWSIVRWLLPGMAIDVVVDQVPPGTYTYHLWIVRGSLAPQGSTIEATGQTCSIIAYNMKR